MKRLFLTTLLILGLIAPSILKAHEPSKHKGKATEGEIVSVGGDRFEMKTATGNVTVTFSDKTKFEHGDQAATKDHLKKGEHVSVIGTKLASGELVAREVLLGASGSHKGRQSKAGEGEQSKAGHTH